MLAKILWHGLKDHFKKTDCCKDFLNSLFLFKCASWAQNWWYNINSVWNVRTKDVLPNSVWISTLRTLNRVTVSSGTWGAAEMFPTSMTQIYSFFSEAHIFCAGIIVDQIRDSLSSHVKILVKAWVHDWCKLLQCCRSRLWLQSVGPCSPSPENSMRSNWNPSVTEPVQFCRDHVQEIFDSWDVGDERSRLWDPFRATFFVHPL